MQEVYQGWVVSALHAHNEGDEGAHERGKDEEHRRCLS